MSDSDLTDDAGTPQMPDLAEAKMKLQSATELLRQLNDETQAASAAPGSTAETPEKP